MMAILLCACGRNSITAPYGSTLATAYRCRECCDEAVLGRGMMTASWRISQRPEARLRPTMFPVWRDRSEHDLKEGGDGEDA